MEASYAVEPKPNGRRRIAFGLGVVASLLAVVVVADVDWSAIAAEVVAADPRLLAAAFLASLLAQLAWSSVTATFLGTVESVPTDRVRVGYLAGTFAKQVLPLGHAGGVPLLAYVLAEDLELDYRRTFAAVTASELVIFLGSLVVAVAGFGWFVLTAAPAAGGGTGTVAVALAAVLAVVAALVGCLRHRRSALRRSALAGGAVGRATVGRLLPRAGRRLAPDAIDRGLADFFEAFDRATADRRTVVRAAAFALCGWLLFALPLHLGFLAVGHHPPLALSLFVVPAAGLATLLPTPGGLGGTEIGAAAAIVLLTGTAVDVVAAAVLLYRVATYWLVVLVGGVCSLYLSAGLGGRPVDGERSRTDAE
ncbi:lysylphosphatidylglycerol synthase transmembrane domain-containing protein [Halegenticoccus tardaugens]|uniref:lysylphosphatidylglycerol synthase transmembrane domain-containing protein n=1 Tax=Halegenticoccus tardaugens TaxID=2071624 RepID=UPI0013E959CB|nr:lysylphosphatidylglycerol synthase transmembrane domain-containing protein [Halegenticoccus tardaugens]